jgi:hypothetical protein
VSGITRLDELVGHGVRASELERLRRVDALLRSLPGPPPVLPRSLTIAAAQLARLRPYEPPEARA